MEIINVIAISTKKEKGWVKVAPISGNGAWQDSGMRFDKDKFGNVFDEAGLYAIEYVNTASLGATALEVMSATKVVSFAEVANDYSASK